MPDKYRLLTSQRNILFQLIQESGLRPADFMWVDTPVGEEDEVLVPTIVHAPTEFYCRFEEHFPWFWIYYSPGKQRGVEHFQTKTWNHIPPQFSLWLAYIQREAALPDLWDTLTTGRTLTDSVAKVDDNDNSIFTAEERVRVVQGLEEIKSYLKSAKAFTLEQQKVIDGKFEYLIGASSRMGRKDWLTLLLGTLLSTAVTVGLDGSSTRDWIGFAANIVLQFAGYLLLPPTPHY